jgi:hypothetical protein
MATYCGTRSGTGMRSLLRAASRCCIYAPKNSSNRRHIREGIRLPDLLQYISLLGLVRCFCLFFGGLHGVLAPPCLIYFQQDELERYHSSAHDGVGE